MARPKSEVTKAGVFTLGKIVNALFSKKIADSDVRGACQAAGIAAVGQNELSPWLKSFHETFDGEPLEQLVVLAGLLPENLLLALLCIAREFINARVETVYQNEGQTKTLLKQKEMARDLEAANAAAALEAKSKECDRAKNDAEELQRTITELRDRIKEMEMDIAKMEGRLEERKSQAEKLATVPESSTESVVSVEKPPAAPKKVKTAKTSSTKARQKKP